MPARLPDEELAPVEGASPPGQVVAPTALGLNVGAEALSSAATTQLRAQVVEARRQAKDDEVAVAPTLVSLQGALNDKLEKATAAYHGEPGFDAQMRAAGQDVLAGYKPQRDAMPEGQQRVFDLGAQRALLEHQAGALKVQTATQATAIEGATKAQDALNLNKVLLPTLSQIQQFEGQLKLKQPGDPTAVDTYAKAGQGMADSNWPAASAALGLDPAQTAAMKPQYDMEVQKELFAGASRLRDTQAHYADTHLISGVNDTLNTVLDPIDTDPTQYATVTAPGGPIYKALEPLGQGEAYDAALHDAMQSAAVKYVEGLHRIGEDDLARQALDGGTLDKWLPKEVKTTLENGLAKTSPNALAEKAAAATFAIRNEQDLAYRATEGGSIYTPAELAQMQQAMTPDAFATYQARAALADQTFAAGGGKPIAQQSLHDLHAIHAPTDEAAPDFIARQSAYNAAQAQIGRLIDDPASAMMGMGKSGVKTKGGAPPAPGSADAMGARLTGELAALPTNGQANPAAGAAYANDQAQSQVIHGLDPMTGLRMLPKPVAAQLVTAFETAPTAEAKREAGMSLRGLLMSFPGTTRLTDGTVASPRAIAVRDLIAAGIKRGDIAAMVYSSDTDAGKAAFARYMGATTDPELRKQLPQGQGQALAEAVSNSLAAYVKTNQGDGELNGGLQDYVYAQARWLMAHDPTLTHVPAAAARQAAKSLTDEFQINGALRMPTSLANAPFRTASQVSMLGVFTGQAAPQIGPKVSVTGDVKGWDLAHAGMDLARKVALANDGANIIPPHGEEPKVYMQAVAHTAFWTNSDDGHVMLATPVPGGGLLPVYDKMGFPITLTFQQAIADAQKGKSSYESPPPMSVKTPAGHPLYYTPAPVAAAAAAGAIVHQQAAPVPGSQPVPGGPVGTGGNPGTGRAGLIGGPAGVVLNATQRLLQAVNARPDVVAMFAGPQYDHAAAQGGAAAAPQGYPRLNIPQNQAVQALLPNLIHQESGGHVNAVSPAGALGLMQLMPDTIRQWAPRIGLPVDMHRALHDRDYNLAIGAALLNSLTSHYMTGAVPNAGIALALAAYNAGPGAVELGHHDKHGVYHPPWLQTIGDPRAGNMTVDQWIERIPYKQTRDYVRAIMARTTHRLAGVVGAGPPVG